MLDLFDTPPVAGLMSVPELISSAEEDKLIAAIDESGLLPFRFQQWTGKRLTRSFGFDYDFETRRITRADPMPDWLQMVRARVANRVNLEAEALIQALVIRYNPGASIGWHRDRPIYEEVAGLSLGAPADMRFRRRRADRSFDRATLPLEPRAAYRLSGEARHDWEHSIVELAKPRWSITFRSASSRFPTWAG